MKTPIMYWWFAQAGLVFSLIYSLCREGSGPVVFMAFLKGSVKGTLQSANNHSNTLISN
jgi:hypothetical protein